MPVSKMGAVQVREDFTAVHVHMEWETGWQGRSEFWHFPSGK